MSPKYRRIVERAKWLISRHRQDEYKKSQKLREKYGIRKLRSFYWSVCDMRNLAWLMADFEMNMGQVIELRNLFHRTDLFRDIKDWVFRRYYHPSEKQVWTYTAMVDINPNATYA